MATEKIRLYIVAPNPNDSTSFYRAWGPLFSLNKEHPHIELLACDTTNLEWLELKASDVIFVQRPDSPTFVEIIHKARALGKPVWLDYDDLLTGVPLSNPSYMNYRQESVQKAVKDCIDGATIVSFSTQALAEYMCPKGQQYTIIPNAWDNHLFSERQQPSEDLFRRIVWRGSPTHDKDLLSVADAIESVTKEWKNNIKWYFMGVPSWQVLERINSLCSVEVIPWAGLLDYHAKLKAIKPDIAISPLDDSPFNHAKSNCAWLEFTRVGAVTLAADLPEFQKPGITNYTNGNFDLRLEELLSLSFEDRKKLWTQSWNHISSELRLTMVNKTRLKLIERLVGVR